MIENVSFNVTQDQIGKLEVLRIRANALQIIVEVCLDLIRTNEWSLFKKKARTNECISIFV